MSPAPLRNIAVFGAGGNNIGNHILHNLLKHPEFNVIVIARASSTTSFPSGVKVIKVADDLEHAELVAAFRGQDAIVSAIGYPAKYSEPKLIDAAIEAGVKRFLPSEYGLNNSNPNAQALNPVFNIKGQVLRYLQEKESTGLTWTVVPTGMWLDWAPALPFLGINTQKHTAELLGEGDHELSFSTLPWAAEGIAQILLHPEQTANKIVPVRAFEASLTDLVRLLEKEQGVKYDVTKVDSKKYIADAQAQVEAAGERANIPAVYDLIKAGFVLKGYGSNFVTEGSFDVSSEDFEMSKLEIQDVIRAALH